MLRRRYRINLSEQFQHESVGRWLAVKGHRQAGPDDQRDIVDGIVAHERVVAWHLAAVEIQTVRSKRHQRYPIPIPLALRRTRILRFRAVEPLALIGGTENLAPDQPAYPGGQIVRGRDDASGGEGIGRILVRGVIGLEGSRLGRNNEIGGIRRIRQGIGRVQ